MKQNYFNPPKKNNPFLDLVAKLKKYYAQKVHTHYVSDIIDFDPGSGSTLLLEHTGDTSIHFHKDEINLGDLSNVDTGSTTEGQSLTYSGGTWVPANVSTDLSNYYTKPETYSQTEVDNLLTGVTVDLSNYYIKPEVYNTGETYSQIEVDNLLTGITTDLSNYYTKVEVYNTGETYTQNEVDLLINNIDLTPYYTSGQTDNLLDDKLDISTFNIHTGDTSNTHETTFNNLVSTAHTHQPEEIVNLLEYITFEKRFEQVEPYIMVMV